MSRVLLTTTTAAKLLAYAGLGLLALEILVRLAVLPGSDQVTRTGRGFSRFDLTDEKWNALVQAAYKALTEEAACWEVEFDGGPGLVLICEDAVVVTARLLAEEAERV